MTQALNRYRDKRDFKQTPEPAPRTVKTRSKRRGDAAGDGTEGSFVIQLHHARRKHYDFRLEIDGVLKSWAIPKGPSLDPALKRLAVEVEDHPIEYGGFSGDIPAGHYGAGHVEIWDRGHWRPEGDVHAMLRSGDLKFTLLGARLAGSWALIRTQRPARQPQWLLIKHQDDAVVVGDEADEEPIDDWLKQLRPVSKSMPAEDKKNRVRKGNRKASARPPETIELALARSVAEAPEGDDWLHEVKYDGYRMLLWRDGDEIRLLSRGGIDWTDKLPTMAAALRALPCDSVILDAELVALDEDGVSRFALLQDRFGAKKTAEGLVGFVFDLLFVDGVDRRTEPLLQRRLALEKLLATPPTGLVVSSALRGNGGECFRHARERGLEGIVSKRVDSSYAAGRGGDWVKTKTFDSDEFAVVGYTPGQGARARMGSLLLAAPVGKKGWRYVGRVGSGLNDAIIASLLKTLRPIDAPVAVEGEPSRAALKGAKPVWVKPLATVEVEFRGLTGDGLLRQAALKAVREDKPPSGLREPDRSPKLHVATKKSGGKGARTMPKPAASEHADLPHLSHADRRLWIDPPITKEQLAAYYERVADWVLPELIGRPLSLLRCPDGMAGECFFQKQLTPGFPPSVHAKDVGGSGTNGPVVYVEDLAGLIGLVQMSVLELHVWGSRIDRVEKPDRIVMDLDPAEDVAWSAVIAAARLLRERLQQVGMESFVRTSGGKGLHVVVPLSGEDSWGDVKDFSHALAGALEREQPDRYIDTASKTKRKGLIFIDWLRNGRGSTAIAGYSPRARAGAGVATPVGWDELGRMRSGAHYDLSSIERRLKSLKQDPWAGLKDVRQALPRAIDKPVNRRKGTDHG